MVHPHAPIFPPGFASHALQSIQKVQQGVSSLELLHTAHEHWPFRPGKNIHRHPTLRVSVLDASFNPPTLAHLALANSPSPSLSPQRSDAISIESYDARILLLSVRNADKVLKPGDATFVQRLEMMHLLSHEISATVSEGEYSQMSANVAIGVIDEPTFVGKSTLLLRFLQTRLATVVGSSHSPSIMSRDRDASNHPFPSPKLTFHLGFDTLVRLFSPKYYPSEQAMIQMLRTFLSPDQEDCRIVCTNGGSPSADKTLQENQDKAVEVASEFITSDRIAFIDIGTEEQSCSSSEVRTKVATGDWTWRRLVTAAIADYIIKREIYSSWEKEQ